MKQPAKKTRRTVVKQPVVRHASRGEKTRFYILILLLVMSLVLAWVINTGMSQTLSDQFS